MKTNQGQDFPADGMPHIYRVQGYQLPAGLVCCVLCERDLPHGEITAFDEDLVGYLCGPCTRPLSMAEMYLRQTPGIGMPRLEDLLELEDR